MKITFKRGERLTGLAAVASPLPDVEIKYGGQEIGFISSPRHAGLTPDPNWRVFLRVPNDDPKRNYPWKNVKLKAKFREEQDARRWVQAQQDQILQRVWKEGQ